MFWQTLIDFLQVGAEAIKHIRTIRALTCEAYVLESFCATAARPHRTAFRRHAIEAAICALNGCFFALHWGLSYIFGFYLVSGGYISPYIIFQ